ncbi:MAG TPA: ABC transporter ATP-binding protein [Methylovirgula sp.]|nr:ABC transporter ATP-binding protein [Methylovirgula sp.]
MSSDIAISCRGVGKAFQLYTRRNDQLMQTLFGRWKQFFHPHWVLRDISFEVKRGECWGIIGRNGTGKTTLLQLICGISRPTYGEIDVSGRVAPILALGAGFDPELTGRENAMIGGAILGLRRADILARLDSIAAFADIGEFFYQPLKMYSSGMTARLAFAVCAHVDADILIVDEALSVGDATFAKKCDDFIRRFAARGTILVVSHDLPTLESLCDHVIWIEDGRVAAYGRPTEVIAAYRHAFNIPKILPQVRLIV